MLLAPDVAEHESLNMRPVDERQTRWPPIGAENLAHQRRRRRTAGTTADALPHDLPMTLIDDACAVRTVRSGGGCRTGGAAGHTEAGGHEEHAGEKHRGAANRNTLLMNG